MNEACSLCHRSGNIDRSTLAEHVLKHRLKRLEWGSHKPLRKRRPRSTTKSGDEMYGFEPISEPFWLPGEGSAG